MKNNPFHINNFHQKDNTSIWEWKGTNKNRRNHKDNKFSITQIFQESKQKLEEAVVGPGAGYGIGCGIGMGLGMVGGMGIGNGSSWNQVKMVFGIGMGCGVGVGVGFGHGVGVGCTLEEIKKKFFRTKGNNPRKPIVIKI